MIQQEPKDQMFFFPNNVGIKSRMTPNHGVNNEVCCVTNKWLDKKDNCFRTMNSLNNMEVTINSP